MIYEFDEFVLDTACVELRNHRQAVPLEPKNFDLLLLLVRNSDRVVTKNEIFEQIWPGVFVTDASLSGAIKQIRRALGDDGTAQKFIKTVHGRGFRLVTEVVEHRGQPSIGLVQVEPAEENKSGNLHDPPAIAVLPFRLINTEDRQNAIAEAVPSELIAALSRLRSIRVIARGSAFRFGPTDIDFDDIHTRLGAAYVLSGSVELFGGRLVVVAELTDVRNHLVVWCETFSGPLGEVFEVRQTIVSAVANAAEHRVAMNEADRLLRVPSENLDAWGLYHLAVHHLYRFNRADNDKAEHFLARAAELDPRFARAFAGLSYTELERYNLGFGSEKSRHRSQALSLAEKAVDLDPYDPFCNLVLGRAKWIHEDLDEAISWVDRSIELNPNYAFAHYNSGKLNAIVCQGGLADDHVRSAMGLSPIDPHLQSMLSARALAAFVRDDAHRAIEFADQSIRAPNAHLYVCLIGAAVLISYGQDEKAGLARQKLDRLKDGFSEEHFWSLFSLREPGRQAVLSASMGQLGL